MATLGLEQQCKVVQRGGDIRMVRSEGFLPNRQGALEEWLGLVMTALISI